MTQADDNNDNPKKLNKLSVECDVDHIIKDSIEIDYASYVNPNSKYSVEGAEEVDSEQVTKHNQSQAIDFSNRIMLALETKAKNFNQDYSPKKITVKKLKEIYISSILGCKAGDSKNLTAFTRINKFLNVISNFKSVDPKRSKMTFNDLELINAEEKEEYFSLGKKDIDEFNLDFDFENLDELFIEIPKTSLSYEIEY